MVQGHRTGEFASRQPVIPMPAWGMNAEPTLTAVFGLSSGADGQSLAGAFPGLACLGQAALRSCPSKLEWQRGKGVAGI